MTNEEKLLRENIRNAITIVQKKKEEAENQALLEERMLREVIRKIIKEDAESPSQSTAINVLEELLKKIIPVLEEDFKALTTNVEQRDSFRSHIVNGIENLLAPAEVNADVEDAEGAEGIEALEELLQQLNEITVTVGDEMPAEFIDIYGDDKAEVDDEEEATTEEEEFAKGLEEEEFNLVGRNMAFKSFKKVRQNIVDSFEIVAPDDEDREIFYDYLITNVKLYFDRFEEELAAMVVEPTTPEYEKRVAGEKALAEYVDLDALLEGLQI
tara:strand:- start:2409 stop:3218 length:810 start_codon:yes stop_codon:yes gene_type:complete